MVYFSENFGVNKFLGNQKLPDIGEPVRVFLEGFDQAESVLLMGTFPDRNDSRNVPMQKVKTGWEKILQLEPGKYFYHFKIGEKIYTDPNNEHLEPDGEGVIRSVLFVPNYRFELDDYPTANTVFVSANFNHWHVGSIELKRINNTWQLPIYLKDGTYAYKFVVDGNWITDPQNPILHPDGNGNYNSHISIGPISVFRLYGHTDAREVRIAGNFNLWDYTEMLMQKTPSGWEFQYALQQGIYEYKFIVDGEWITDPNTPYLADRPYGVNSIICVNPNYIFKLEGYPEAAQVIVTGSFNKWDGLNYKMVYNNGLWRFPICLTPGKHSYFFIVDGEAIPDPSNPVVAKSEYGVDCSSLIIENE